MALLRASNFRALLLAALSLTLAAPACVILAATDLPAAIQADQLAQEEFFEAKIRPLIVTRCLDCHGSEKSKGGLRLDSRDAIMKGAESGPVVLPGKPDESPLIAAIRYEGDVQMPPKGKLKAEEIASLTDWVKRGAFWPAARPTAGLSHVELDFASIRCRCRLQFQDYRLATVVLVIPACREPAAARGQGCGMACLKN